MFLYMLKFHWKEKKIVVYTFRFQYIIYMKKFIDHFQILGNEKKNDVEIIKQACPEQN